MSAENVLIPGNGGVEDVMVFGFKGGNKRCLTQGLGTIILNEDMAHKLMEALEQVFPRKLIVNRENWEPGNRAAMRAVVNGLTF